MGTNWIKMRVDLLTDPAVVAIASRLGVTCQHVAGCLLQVWAIFDAHTTDGFLSRYKRDSLDAITSQPGLCAAMQEVGWLIVTDDGLRMPNFETHGSNSAKARACAQKRQQKHRSEKGVLSRFGHGSVTVEALPDKIRLDKNNTPPISPPRSKSKKPSKTEQVLAVEIPEPLDTPGFRSAWAEWIEYRRADLRKAVTPRSAKMQLNALAEMGESGAVESIRQSIRNNWAGLFPPKDQPQQRPAGKRKATLPPDIEAEIAESEARRKADRELGEVFNP